MDDTSSQIPAPEVPESQPSGFPSDSSNNTQSPEPQNTHKSRKRLFLILAAVLIVVVGAVAAASMLMHKKDSKKDQTATTANSKKVTLVYAVHWLEDNQINGVKKEDGTRETKGLKQYLDEYTKLHPGIEFAIQQIQYADYADKLQVLNDSGAAPDIFQIYSPWGASYVRKDILDEPSADIQADVKQNYISSAGATIDGKIWGYPTEIDNYALLYNKDLFKQAGIVDSKGEPVAPKNWAELVADAKKLTKRDTKGNITQYGMSFLKDNDWQVVDPFLSLLFSNGGDYLSGDFKHSLVNSPAGVSALDSELQLFKNGSTDSNGNFFDFGKGTVGMVVSPPWPKSQFATAFGANFSKTVGVAPMPGLAKQTTLQYSWFTGVMKNTEHKKEAWDFLKWFASDVQSSGTTRYGDLLAQTIGAIPARKVDFNSHKEVLGDFFTSVYVNQMQNTKAEPNVLQAGAIKSALMTEIQAAWDNKKTSQQALNDASTSIDKILQQSY